METFSYWATIDPPEDTTVCTCGECDWEGTFKDLLEIEDCMLTPGDPSPAGRCPDCISLVYIEKSS